MDTVLPDAEPKNWVDRHAPTLLRPWLKLARRDLTLTRSDEVITYVARNLEPYRGFHILMRSLPLPFSRSDRR